MTFGLLGSYGLVRPSCMISFSLEDLKIYCWGAKVLMARLQAVMTVEGMTVEGIAAER